MPGLGPVGTGKAKTGSGIAPGVAGLLGYAASPVFAAMALLTVLSGAPPDMLCMRDASGLDGMAVMYALMSVFHVGPWLRLMRW